MAEIINAVVLGSVYVAFAIGLTLCWGVLNVLNMAHGAIFMFGTFIAWSVVQNWQIGIVPLVLISLATGALAAMLLQVGVFAHIQKRAQSLEAGEMATLIASIAFASVLVNIADNYWGTEIAALPAGTVDSVTFQFAGATLTTVELAIIGFTAVSVGVLVWVVARTQFGRSLRGIATDPGTARLLGVPVGRISMITLAVSGGLAGAAGLLYASQVGAMNAYMGDALMIKGFAVIIMGGVGSIWGTVVAGYLLAFAETAATLWAPGGTTEALAFVLIIIVLIVRPQGLFRRLQADRV